MSMSIFTNIIAPKSNNSQLLFSQLILNSCFYTIEIKGKAIEEHSFKVTIPDVPTSEKIVKQDVVLKLKN